MTSTSENVVVLRRPGCNECCGQGVTLTDPTESDTHRADAPEDCLRAAPKRRATLRARFGIAICSLAAVIAIATAAARAGSCRVLVALGAVDIELSPSGISLRLSGNWEFDNIIQVVSGLSFNVLLVRGDNFIRLRYPDQSYSGSVPGLAAAVDSGLAGEDIVNVEAAGTTEPAARFVSLEAQRLKVSTPVPLGSGPISIVAYIVLDSDYVSPIISNTITRPLELTAKPSNDDQGDPTDPTDPPVDPTDPTDPANSSDPGDPAPAQP